MITKFEKQAIAWMLTAVLCLFVVLSQGITTYADEPVQGGETLEAEADPENEDDLGETLENNSEELNEENKDGSIKTFDNRSKEEITSESSDGKEGEAQSADQSQQVPKKQPKTISGDFEYNELEDGTIEIVNYNGSDGNLSVPEILDGKTVTSIGEDAFKEQDSLIQVTLPATVTVLRDGAFSFCSNLNKVVLEDGSQLRNIGNRVFLYSGLKEIDCSAVLEIGEEAFSNSALAEIDCSAVQKLGEYAFRSCVELTKVTLGEQMTSLSDGTFYFCHNLKEIILPESIVSIGNSAFAASGIEQIKIPETVTSIGTRAFSTCRSLNTVSIGNTLTEIADYAFWGCNFTTFTIGDKVTKIGENAFSSNGSINEIVIAMNVTEIQYVAFANCTSLGKVSLPNSLKKIGGSAFYNCAMTSITVPASVTEIGETALGYKPSGTGEANDTKEKIPGFTIYGYTGSAAQTYAKQNGFTFLALDVKTNKKVSSNKGEDHIELKIIPEQTDNVYIIGSSRGAIIKCTGELKNFRNVYMDGVKVAEVNYTLEEGSTILTFVTKYLDTLSVGKHKVTMNYSYGSVDSELTILARADASDPTDGSSGTNGMSGTANGTTGTANDMVNSTNLSGNTVSVRTGDDTTAVFWVLTAMIAVGICVVLGSKKHPA